MVGACLQANENVKVFTASGSSKRIEKLTNRKYTIKEF